MTRPPGSGGEQESAGVHTPLEDDTGSGSSGAVDAGHDAGDADDEAAAAAWVVMQQRDDDQR
jgi:hypothetical protein